MAAMRELRCSEIVELITDHLDGALDPETAVALENHLAMCPGCGLYVDQIRATIATLGAVTSDDLPAEMQDDLIAAFRGFRRPGR